MTDPGEFAYLKDLAAMSKAEAHFLEPEDDAPEREKYDDPDAIYDRMMDR